MNIALIGYGKMGKEIEAIALSRGHQISCRVDSKTTVNHVDFSDTDVAIEFTKPDLAFTHIYFFLDKKIPLVIGTTGWNDQLTNVTNKVKETNGSLLHASNFSVGVNIFFEINKRLTQLMAPHTEYNASMTEIHHTQKLDSPSGTAITLADDLIEESKYQKWNCIEDNDGVSSNTPQQLDIIAKRIPDVPGTHIINYSSEIDEIEIKHKAKNRKGFALGAVLAAEWLQGKQGIFTMKNVLNLD
ncbi:4-hydroxy-tetrahydrodipicolinate reductase [Crocinitomicaceae bacterium]|nr:4-hydroxy-tetrahydrodipicolinate reductase [Crocinitomicaceae bacterium]MDC1403226.1 4-hydroxy-tetrahydrodipicolinate reductase [Crocinitomicaceae bacterium]